MNVHDVAASPVVSDTEALNTLLRAELSAVESYGRVIPDFEGVPAAPDLHHIRDTHAEAAAVLRDRVLRLGGVPADGSGPWGAFSAALGPATVLKALQEGERHGVGEYEAVLTDDRLDPESADVIRSQLLPRCREHVLELDRLMAGK
jgi:hypothetical protein